jgi:hypothetical protein
MLKKMLKKTLLAIVALTALAFAAAPAEAACAGGICYFKGGTSAGAVNNVSNWSTVSTTGAACACSPGSTDAVILDSGSTSPMLIGSALSVGTFDASGAGGTGSPYTGTVTHNAVQTLTINTAAANSLKFSAAMTYTPLSSNALVTFANTTGSAVLTSAGKNFGGITVNTGTTGTIGVQLADNLNVTGFSGAILTLTGGTLDAATNLATITASQFSSSGSTARTLTLGGNIKVGGSNAAQNNTIWNTATPTNLTITANARSLEVVSPPAIQGLILAGGGATGLPALLVDDNTGGATVALSITGSSSWPSMTVGAGWNIILPNAGTQTIAGGGTCAFNGTTANPTMLSVFSVNGVATLSSASTSCTATNAMLYGITGSGGATFTATNSVNMGTNAGWSFSGSFGGGGGGHGGIIGG